MTIPSARRQAWSWLSKSRVPKNVGWADNGRSSRRRWYFVRDEEKVDFLGHVLGFVEVRPRKSPIDEGNGRAFVEHGVGKDGLPVQAKQKGTMPEPEIEVFRFRQMVQVGLDNRDLIQFWDSILRHFPKEELPKILQQATLTCE